MNDARPLKERVAEELERLVEVSAELRQAMLDRDPQRIMEVVARGEELAASPCLLQASPRLAQDERIGALARQLRRLQESNHLLAASFLKMYRQVLQPAQDGAEGRAAGYGRAGAVEPSRVSPMLIHQTG